MTNHHPYRSLALPGVALAMCVAPASVAAPVWNLSVTSASASGSAFADPNTSELGSLNASINFSQLLSGFIDANNVVHDFGNADADSVSARGPNPVAAEGQAVITADGHNLPTLQLNWSSNGAISSSSTSNYVVSAEVFSGARLMAGIAGADSDLPVVINFQWSVQSTSESLNDRTVGFDDRSLSDIRLSIRTSPEESFATVFSLTSASQPHLGPTSLDESGSGQIILPPSAEPRSIEILISGNVMNNITSPLPPAADVGSSLYQATASFTLVPPPPACQGDANADNSVDGADLSVLLAQFNQFTIAGTGADFNNDAVVNGADLSVLLSNFGNTCP